MARYLEIGTEIAERIRSGELPAGTELPAIREYHAGLVDALCASGAVDGDWADAFRAVPRHLFVPDAV